MIQNLTKAEWSALVDAINLLAVDLAQNPENYRYARPTGPQIQAALDRAYIKVRQLAPEKP